MNIAIPIHENRVMPRFGCTREMIVVTVEDGRIASRKRLMITPQMWASLPAVLAEEHISMVICGGIHPRFQQALQGQNIQLVWGVVGEWQEVLQAYLNGTLQTNPVFCLHRGFRGEHRLRRGRHQRR
jgi:predicted Fe-Mo cluster-binding NifX family protein